MNDTDKLIERATARLGGDRELQLDIAQELRSHLADADEEYRSAGFDADQAAAEARRAFGDPDELAAQLLRANRSRMRVRAAVRWSARAVLVPASLGIILALGMHLYHAVRPHWSRPSSLSVYAGLTADQVYFLRGDPNATDEVARAKSISDRWPDDPALYARYVMDMVREYSPQTNRGPAAQSVLDTLDRGEQIDPSNAWYNFLKASVLVRASCRTPDDFPFTNEDSKGRLVGIRKDVGRIEILDEAGMKRAVDEVFKGIAKPLCTSRRRELAEGRLKLLGRPEGLVGVFDKYFVGTEGPFHCNDYPVQFGRMLLAYAARQAEAGDANAPALTRAVALMASQRGSETDLLVEVLCADIVIRDALACRVHVRQALGQEDLARADRDELEHWMAGQDRVQHDIDHAERMDMRRAGLLGAVCAPDWSSTRSQSYFTPMKRVEFTVALQFGLIALLAVLTLLGLVFSAAAVETLLARRPNKGLLVFLGWRKMARIVLLAVVVPLGLYGFYAWVQFAPADTYGLNYSLGRVLLEWTAVIVSVAVLLIGLSYRAIRRRAAEIGLAVPRGGRRPDWGWMVAGMGVLLAAGYAAGWWLGLFQPAEASCPFSQVNYWYLPGPNWSTRTGYVLAGALAAWMAALGLAKAVATARMDAKYRYFRRTFYRSLAPILAVAVVLVGLACSAGLRTAESQAAGCMVGKAGLGSWNEVEDTACRAYKTRLLDTRARYLREWTQQAEPAPTEASAGDMRHSRAQAECGKGDES